MTIPSEASSNPAPPVHDIKNGLGTAALVCAIVGLALSWIPIIGFFGFILGILAVVFGGVGLYRASQGTATNKSMASIGTGLGAVAIIISFAVFGSFANEVSKSTDTAAAPAPEAAPAVPVAPDGPAPAQTGPVTLAFGESHTWGGGETITVSAPEEATQSNPYLAPDGRLASFDVTVHNGGDDEYQVSQATLTAQHNGRVAQQDYMSGDFLPDVQIPPGGETTFTVVYEVGDETGELQLSVQPNYFAADTVYYKGEF